MNILRAVGVTTPVETRERRALRLAHELDVAEREERAAEEAMHDAIEEHKSAVRHTGLVRAEIAAMAGEVG